MGKSRVVKIACAKIVPSGRQASMTRLQCPRHLSACSQQPAHQRSEGEIQLWTWGRSDMGQLALGDEIPRKRPHQVQTITISPFQDLARLRGHLRFSSHCANGSNFLDSSAENVAKAKDENRGAGSSVGISCGLFHSALWSNGSVWMWGKGDGGRLGLDSEVSKYVPTLVENLSDVRSVALGGLHSIMLTENGKVYTCGYGGFGVLGHGIYNRELQPRLVESLESERVIHVAAGGSHSAAISQSGEVYTWGRDEGDGRLGHGNEDLMNEGVLATPLKVHELPEPVAVVACGGFFTMALSLDGQIWSWGGNSNYELGRGDSKSDFRPKQVVNIHNTRIVQVACGGYHSCALTEDGKVLTWGRGGHGQLGHGNLANGKVPQVVEMLSDQCVVSVACGSLWTAVATESGALYTWGKNRDYQLGVPGLGDIQTVPVKVAFQSRYDQPLQAHHIFAISAGASHGMCLVHLAL